MESSPTPNGPDVEHLRVPGELLKQMQEANERFHTAKQQMEETMRDSEYDHGGRLEAKMEQFRKAERDVEEIQRKIQEIVKQNP